MLDLTNIAMNALFGQHLLLVMCVAFGTDMTPFRSRKGALSTGISMIIVLMVVLPITRLIDQIASYYLLEHLSLVALSLVGLGVPYLLSRLMREVAPVMWRYLGRAMARLETNAGVLGAVLLAQSYRLSVFESVLYGFFAGLSVLMALICFVGIEEKMSPRYCPKILQGTPILLLTAGLMSLPLMGFYGLIVTKI